MTNVETITTYKGQSQERCSIYCAGNPLCVSANFCSGGLCSLKAGDIFTLGVELASSPYCKYIGMKRDEIPQCEVSGDPILISDNGSAVCEISKKLKAAEWGDWSGVFEDEVTVDEWRRTEKGGGILEKYRVSVMRLPTFGTSRTYINHVYSYYVFASSYVLAQDHIQPVTALCRYVLCLAGYAIPAAKFHR